MKNLTTEIIISTPSEKAWNIHMDHKNYPNWNPFITELSGSTKEVKYHKRIQGYE